MLSSGEEGGHHRGSQPPVHPVTMPVGAEGARLTLSPGPLLRVPWSELPPLGKDAPFPLSSASRTRWSLRESFSQSRALSAPLPENGVGTLFLSPLGSARHPHPRPTTLGSPAAAPLLVGSEPRQRRALPSRCPTPPGGLCLQGRRDRSTSDRPVLTPSPPWGQASRVSGGLFRLGVGSDSAGRRGLCDGRGRRLERGRR